METCCTHNMLRLTRALFSDAAVRAPTPTTTSARCTTASSPRRIPSRGMMTYFQATRPGYVRLYPHARRFVLVLHGHRHGEPRASTATRSTSARSDALCVNLFIPSVVTWTETGLTLRQTTRFPDEASTRLTVRLSSGRCGPRCDVRQPGWCTGMTRARERPPLDRSAGCDGYVGIEREWRTGDVVDVRLPMTLRVEPLPGAADIVAFVVRPDRARRPAGPRGPRSRRQIIVNERESGTMLNAPVDIPLLAGDPATLRSISHRTPQSADIPHGRHREAARHRAGALLPARPRALQPLLEVVTA